MITEGEPLNRPGPRIQYVNQAFTDITGYEPEEVIGRTPRILQGPDTEPWVLRRLRRRLEEGKSFEGEATNYRKDGTPYVNHWSISPVRDADGTVSHWVSVQRDVTERRRMDERLLMAQERERHRTARRINDEIGALLTSMQIAIAQAQWDSESETAGVLDNLEARIDVLANVVRSLTNRASPRVLEDFGLSRALSQLATDIEETWDLNVVLRNELTREEQLSPLINRVLYRVLREALLNVAQHANADSVQVLAHELDGQLRLHINDDGQGFDPESDLDPQHNYGLSGIWERVGRLNGEASLQTAPGDGTRITVTLPRSVPSPP